MHYCYGVWQDRFQPMQDGGVIFHEGIPDHQTLVQGFSQGQGVMVLDDLMDEGSNDKRVLEIFTKHSQHQTSQSFTCAKTCFLWANMPKAFPAMPITSWRSRARRINWGYAMSSFSRFITPPRALMGIWCWICILPRPTNNSC